MFMRMFNYSFQRRHGIPAIGVIDCTQVAIFPPPAEDEENPEHVYGAFHVKFTPRSEN